MSSLTWKRALGKFYPQPNPQARKIILLYHAVGNGPLAMRPEIFLDQMQFLQSHCEIVSLTQLLQQKSESNKIQVAITFDDGYTCLGDVAAPLLQQVGAAAMVYLNTGWIADAAILRKKSEESLGHYPHESFLVWDEVKALQQAGWEIGSHGVNHLAHAELPSEEAIKELADSKLMIEQKLQQPCQHFAYTWGRYSGSLKKMVADAGYCYAVGAKHAPLLTIRDAFALPRMNIANEYSFEDFKNIILGKWDFIISIQKFKSNFGK